MCMLQYCDKMAVESLFTFASLTDGRSARDLPKQRREKMLQGKQKLNYFTSSDPHHDMLGGGCQVRVVI